MSSKIEKFLVLTAAIAAIVFAGIHLAWQGELAKLESRREASTLMHRQAVSDCIADVTTCARADYLGSHVAEDNAAVENATKQAWLFLVLAIGVPCALLTIRMGVRRLTQSVGSGLFAAGSTGAVSPAHVIRGSGDQNGTGVSHNARIVFALAIATSAGAFPNDVGVYAQSARRPVKPPIDVCQIGDFEQMSRSSPVKRNYAGTWRLDPSRSEGLSALWASATSITMVVTQDAKRLQPVLTVAAGASVMVNSRYSYPLDGSSDYRADGKGEVISDLRYDDGGRAVVLRTTEFAQVDDVEIVHEEMQRWEFSEGGRALRVCRRLEGPLTRTVSMLVFVKGSAAGTGTPI